MKEKNNQRIFEDFGLLSLSITLFLGGGLILSLKIPFWSMFLGIVAIQIGIVFSIFTFETFTKRRSRAITEDYKSIPCLVCKRLNFVPKYQNTTICDSCQLRIARASKSFMIIVLAFFSLTSLAFLVKNNQDIREKASEIEYNCEQGVWNPEACSCATNEKFDCPEGFISRKCNDNNTYCCKMDNSQSPIRWDCQKAD